VSPSLHGIRRHRTLAIVSRPPRRKRVAGSSSDCLCPIAAPPMSDGSPPRRPFVLSAILIFRPISARRPLDALQQHVATIVFLLTRPRLGSRRRSAAMTRSPRSDPPPSGIGSPTGLTNRRWARTFHGAQNRSRHNPKCPADRDGSQPIVVTDAEHRRRPATSHETVRKRRNGLGSNDPTTKRPTRPSPHGSASRCSRPRCKPQHRLRNASLVLSTYPSNGLKFKRRAPVHLAAQTARARPRANGALTSRATSWKRAATVRPHRPESGRAKVPVVETRYVD